MDDGYVKIGHVAERNADGVFSGGVDLFVRSEDAGHDYIDRVISTAGSVFANLFRQEMAQRVNDSAQ